MLLLNVCNRWTNIALSTPALWTTVHVPSPCTKAVKKGLQAWFQRTGNCPLSLSLRGTFNKKGVPDFIWEYGRRFKHLEIYDRQEADEDDHAPRWGGLPTLNLIGAQSTGRLPLLHTLTIGGSGLEQEQFSGQQILGMLSSALNIEECTFHDVRPVSEDEIRTTAPKLVLPALRRMMFGPGAGRLDSDDCIVKFLTLPAVQMLYLSLRSLTGDDLLSFLRRSSPPLTELILGEERLNSTILAEFLHLVPTLERFEMRSLGSSVMNALLLVLVNSPSMLPDLHTLRIEGLYSSSDGELDSCWETLLRVLSSRSKLGIVHVQLKYENSSSFKLTPGIAAAFRNLAQNGLQIHIGSGYSTSNLVSA
ncbi:hypothetical protein DFH06DRAFT_293438 [Mycena polygramma]|nr:hypothetical protein DFH06DRAFT_293438 [Mycena polygramma]